MSPTLTESTEVIETVIEMAFDRLSRRVWMRESEGNAKFLTFLRAFVETRASVVSEEIVTPSFSAKTPGRAKPDGLTPVALRAITPADRSLPPIGFASKQGCGAEPHQNANQLISQSAKLL